MVINDLEGSGASPKGATVATHEPSPTVSALPGECQLAGHTPGPWTAEPGAGRGAWIKGANGEWSALACGDDDLTAGANADFIVRACNSHYELLIALCQYRDDMRYPPAPDSKERRIAMVEALIAKARGK